MMDLLERVMEERTSIVNFIYELSDETRDKRHAQIMREIAVKIEELHDIKTR